MEGALLFVAWQKNTRGIRSPIFGMSVAFRLIASMSAPRQRLQRSPHALEDELAVVRAQIATLRFELGERARIYLA